MMKEIE